LRKATEFYDAAVLVEDTPDAAVDLFILTGIAAAHVICCSQVGVHALGENHNEALGLLEKAERSVAKYLRTLLSLKPQLTKAGVSTGGSTHSARESTWSGTSLNKTGRKNQL
jgi:hypothetical protein